MTQDFAFDECTTALVSLAQAAEARNKLTRGHSERVALVARGIARELGFSDEGQDRILLTGRLHNIGIVGTRDTVLLKTEKLTMAEYEHVKAHTTLGAEILGAVKGMEDIAEVCLSHHERWNGFGYPNSLEGEDIPLNARIVGVADVFVAIISERPHRDSMPRPVAADIIAEERGKLLCPTCVDAFMKWFEQTGGKIDLPEGI